MLGSQDGTACLLRYRPPANHAVKDFARHYGTSVLPARPRHPQDTANRAGATGLGALNPDALGRAHRWILKMELLLHRPVDLARASWMVQQSVRIYHQDRPRLPLKLKTRDEVHGAFIAGLIKPPPCPSYVSTYEGPVTDLETVYQQALPWAA